MIVGRRRNTSSDRVRAIAATLARSRRGDAVGRASRRPRAPRRDRRASRDAVDPLGVHRRRSRSTRRSSAWRPRRAARALARRIRRRHLHVGRRALLRLDRRHGTSTSRSSAWPRRRPATATGSSPATAASSPFGDAHFYGSTGAHAPQPADRRHGRDALRSRLLADRPRRRRLLLRRRALLRLDRRASHLNQPIVGGAATPERPRLLVRRRATAASSRSATRTSTARSATRTCRVPIVEHGARVDRQRLPPPRRERRASSTSAARRTTAPRANACPGAPAVAIATAPHAQRLLDRVRQRAGVRALARLERRRTVRPRTAPQASAAAAPTSSAA